MNSKLAGEPCCPLLDSDLFPLVCTLFLPVIFHTIAQNTKQMQDSEHRKKKKTTWFLYIYPSRFLVSFRKQRIHFPESLQGHLMLCSNIFNYISSRLLLIASSNSTSSVALSSSAGEPFTPELSSLSHSLVVSDMLFNKAHIMSPSKW